MHYYYSNILILICFQFTFLVAQEVVQRGYYFVQSVSTYHVARYGAITGTTVNDDTVTDADKLFALLKKYQVDGVEFEPLWFDKENLVTHQRVASIAKQYSIDLWESDWRLIQKINHGAFGSVPESCAAWGILPDGTLQRLQDSTGNYYIDVLNPLSHQWLLDSMNSKSYGTFLKALRHYVQGYFFDETRVLYGVSGNDLRRPPYWKINAYSPAVLTMWRQYCVKHQLKDFQGNIIDKFPVHRQDWERKNTLTYYQPGYQESIELKPGIKFSELPCDNDVWKHWFRFICKTFAQVWLSPISRYVDAVLAGTQDWKGIAYFQLIPWSIDYTDPLLKDIILPQTKIWGAWSTAFGVDMREIVNIPDIRFFICEGYPPLTTLQKQYFLIFNTIVSGARKLFGMMVHRDETKQLFEVEELKRWEVIKELSPIIIARYPLSNMFSLSPNFNEEEEKKFLINLNFYKKNKL